MQRLGFVIYPGFQVLGLSILTVFEIANIASGKQIYQIEVLSENGGNVQGSAAVAVDSQPIGRHHHDTMIVCGGTEAPKVSSKLSSYLRTKAESSRRIAAICTGAFVLAEAGLLNGRRATTHWLLARDLQARFPEVTVEENRICVVDGPIWTSAGMTAGIDLALSMLEEDVGPELARVVARRLVVFHRRAGGQSQYSTLVELEPKSDRIQTALTFARRNLRTGLTVEELAGAAGLSPRQFSRTFRAETGQSPAKAVEHLRVEAARLMLEQSVHSIDVVAQETGFADRERMRRAFLRAFGYPPRTIRRNAQPLER
ncbi:GlxA family transcriptional regulator [Bradyrhizobium erythrophlei]|uniref:Transcriptional regulator, AraC family with amidase-like domain n=1 Tax=Bradyrhizobium erythrophlei TaxID=1437360 RepID=A0A1H4WSL7_9BRAD|nr:GlxA family transcriptional regulator [Bradyrhizobium erythrophlei]SEC96303.1 transcriptional regulator, AraC family with amidase-like domain [Bradyrhizobium erythrophlei]